MKLKARARYAAVVALGLWALFIVFGAVSALMREYLTAIYCLLLALHCFFAAVIMAMIAFVPVERVEEEEPPQ